MVVAPRRHDLAAVFHLSADQRLLDAAREQLPGQGEHLGDLQVAEFALRLGLRIMAGDPTTGYQRPSLPPRRLCAWCGAELTPGSDPPTHGICPSCEEGL
jgi:hypothetical protein